MTPWTESYEVADQQPLLSNFPYSFSVRNSEIWFRPLTKIQEYGVRNQEVLERIIFESAHRVMAAGHLNSIGAVLNLFISEILSTSPEYGGAIPLEQLDDWLLRKIAEIPGNKPLAIQISTSF